MVSVARWYKTAAVFKVVGCNRPTYLFFVKRKENYIKEKKTMMSIFFRVQVCHTEGGDVSHEDFCTYDEAMRYYNNCEVGFGDTCELYKMAEIDNHIHLVDVIKG